MLGANRAVQWAHDPLTGRDEPPDLSRVMRALKRIAPENFDSEVLWSLACAIHFPALLARARYHYRVIKLFGRGTNLRGIRTDGSKSKPSRELQRLARAVQGSQTEWIKAWAGTRQATQDRVYQHLPPASARNIGVGFYGDGFTTFAPPQEEAISAVIAASKEAATNHAHPQRDANILETVRGISNAYLRLTGKPISIAIQRNRNEEALGGPGIRLTREIEQIYKLRLIGQKRARRLVAARGLITKKHHKGTLPL